MSIPDLQVSQKETKRVVAVIAEREVSAREMAAQFAKQGEVVEAVWFADTRGLLAERPDGRFEAVVLFPAKTEADTDADERSLREALASTPIYRVG